MNKSFKKVIACLLAVLMFTFSVPFSAFAVSGTYKANITLQFGVVSDENGDGTWVTSGDPAAETQYATKQNLAINEGFSYLAGPQLEATASANPETGVYSVSKLTLQESDINNIEAAYAPDGTGMASNAESGDYDLQAGDVFTVTVKLEGVDQMFAGNARIAFSDNIKPAGFYREGATTKRVSYVGTDVARAEAAKEYVGFNSPIESASGITVYERFNTLLGDKGSIITDGDGVSYMDCGMAANAGYPVDVTSVTNEELTATYVDKDGNLGYTYPGQMVWETFVFMIVDDSQPINFWFYDPENKALSFDGGWCARDAQENYADTKTTYAANGDAAGSTMMYFCGTNIISGDVLESDAPATHEHTLGAPVSNGDGTHTATCTAADCDQSEGYQVTTDCTQFESEVTKAATCTVAGETTYTCKDCGYSYVDDTTPAASGHTWREDPEVPATCTTNGTAAGRTCTVCDAKEGYATITAPGHNYTDTVIDPTCMDKGYTLHTCSVCGDNYKDAYQNALGHDFSKVIEDVASTETVAGYTIYQCTRCTETKRVDKPLADHVHVWRDDPEVPATCTTNGTKAGRTCTSCGATEGYDTITAPGHTWRNDPEVPATCTTDGTEAGRTCTVCDAKEGYATIKAPGHTWRNDAEVPATCTTDGTEAGRTCTVCDAKEGYATIKAPGHTWRNDAEVPATRQEDGVEAGRTCTVCDAKEGYAVIPALGYTVTVLNTYGAAEDDNYVMLNSGIEWGANNNVKYGKSIKIAPTAVEGAQILGFKVNGKFVAKQSYTTNVFSDMTVQIIAEDTTNSNITITFLDMYKNVIKTITCAKDAIASELATIPQAPNYPGYNFVSWSMTDEQIRALAESATIISTYEAVENMCTVSVVGGTIDGAASKQVQYDTQVTVVGDTGTKAWKIDGKVVSYDSTYTFYVGSDVTVEAVTDAVTSDGAAVSIINKTTPDANNRVTYLATMSVYDGYTLVDHGFIYGKNSDIAAATLDDVNGTTIKAIHAGATGTYQYALTYGIKAGGATARVKAFVIVKNADGYKTITSDTAETVYA